MGEVIKFPSPETSNAPDTNMGSSEATVHSIGKPDVEPCVLADHTESDSAFNLEAALSLMAITDFYEDCITEEEYPQETWSAIKRTGGLRSAGKIERDFGITSEEENFFAKFMNL